MTANSPRQPSPAAPDGAAAVAVSSIDQAEQDEPVFSQQFSSHLDQHTSRNTAGHTHSHWHSHLRHRSVSHFRRHLSSLLSTSSTDDELEASANTEPSNHDTDDLSPASKDQGALPTRETSHALKDADVEARSAESEQSMASQDVQTVSLIRVVDSEGRILETQTVYPSANSGITDSPAGKTADISVSSSTGSAAPGLVPGDSASVPLPHSDDASLVPGTATVSATVSESAESSTATATALPITSTLLPSLSDIPATVSSQNATNTPASSHPTTPATTPASSATTSSFTSTPVPSILKIKESTIPSLDDESSTESDFVSSTMAVNTLARGRHGGSGLAPTSTAAAIPGAGGDGSGSGGGVNLTHQQKQIVGGVVGGVAGAAFFLLLILMAIKWKKKRGEVRELLDERSYGSRGLPSPRGVGGTSGGAPPMVQRSSSFDVAGALASFAGRKSRPPPPSEETGERGFYRVSGRKLPSVLQHGGDGYSDPRRHSTGSESTGQSLEAGGASTLALGSPMRPVSGIAIMRSGPARTPVTEQNPFADPFADPPSPTSFPSPPRGHGLDRGPHDQRAGPTGFRFQESI